MMQAEDKRHKMILFPGIARENFSRVHVGMSRPAALFSPGIGRTRGRGPSLDRSVEGVACEWLSEQAVGAEPGGRVTFSPRAVIGVSEYWQNAAKAAL
jgi:hypothetical protein